METDLDQETAITEDLNDTNETTPSKHIINILPTTTIMVTIATHKTITTPELTKDYALAPKNQTTLTHPTIVHRTHPRSATAFEILAHRDVNPHHHQIINKFPLTITTAPFTANKKLMTTNPCDSRLFSTPDVITPQSTPQQLSPSNSPSNKAANIDTQ
jgi:hypothetical protein